MRFWRSLLLPALVVGAVVAPARAQEQPKVELKPDQPVTVPAPVKPALPIEPKTSKPNRRAWMFGLNLGYGGTRFVGNWVPVTAELRTDTPVETPPLRTLTHNWNKTDIEASSVIQFRVGYALNPKLTVGYERLQWFKDFGHYSWHFNTSTIAATYYPGAAHLFVRGGAGISGLAEKIPATDPLFLEADDRGVTLEGAVGYERSLFKRLSIAPEISLRQMNFGHSIRAQIATASIGLNWWL